MSDDARLSAARVLDLFHDAATTEGAAANPHLPLPVMESILTDVTDLTDEPTKGQPALYLGRWTPSPSKPPRRTDPDPRGA